MVVSLTVGWETSPLSEATWLESNHWLSQNGQL